MRQELTQTKEQLQQVTDVLLNLGYHCSSSHPPPSPKTEDNKDDEDNDNIRLNGIWYLA